MTSGNLKIEKLLVTLAILIFRSYLLLILTQNQVYLRKKRFS